jgi:hypothetical protein
MPRPFKAAHISEIPAPVEPDAGSYEWKPIRHFFNVRPSGVNANIANAGDWLSRSTGVESSDAARGASSSRAGAFCGG